MSEDGHGQGRVHLGWDPDGKVCLGAGPVRLKFSEQEAADLRDALSSLLFTTTATYHCGCGPERPSEAVQQTRNASAGRFGF